MSKKKNLFGFFEQQTTNETEKRNTESPSDKEIESDKLNTEKYTVKLNTETEQLKRTEKHNTEKQQGVEQEKGFMEQFQKKIRRPTIEETHQRQTYLIDKNLLSRLDRIAKNQPKGFKTAVVNEGIRRVLDEIEKGEQ
jgi:hypothetical protein